MEPIRVFIGFDQREAIAYHTLCQSILSRSSIPVSFIPVKRSMLKNIHSRPLDEKQSNEFSFTRFLVPHLSGYLGHSIFIDCDMLFQDDIAKLWELRDPFCSVQVVKHDYTPKNQYKYLGTKQHPYPKKNWSSVMIFNNAHFHCKKLTPEYVNNASGLELHQFKWTDEDRIGELPKEWNHLVSEYPPNKNAKNIHFTVGGPYFHEYENCEFSEEWFNERSMMQNCDQLDIPKVKINER